MRLNREKREEQYEKKLAKERQKDIKGGDEAVDTKFKALEYLLSQSKVLEIPLQRRAASFGETCSHDMSSCILR